MTILFLLLLGLALGSFINALVYRLENRISFGFKRSACPTCKHVLAPVDLIPVVSFLFLRGKCRYCKKRISWQYPSVELVMAVALILPVVARMMVPFSVPFYTYSIFVFILVIIFTYDLRYMLIPDKISIPAIVLVFFVQLYLGNLTLMTAVIAASVAGGFFLIQFVISKGRWIGGGDIRLGVLMGFMLGWPYIIIALILSYFMGTAIMLPLVAFKKRGFKSKVPFGVFLTLATIVTLVYGNKLVSWYVTLILRL